LSEADIQSLQKAWLEQAAEEPAAGHGRRLGWPELRRASGK
jgi:hypothetical protein